VSDLIDEGDTVAFVMEYVEGETLKEYLERRGKLTDSDIRDIFSQMLDAVGYVHEQKLVHRDIKPSNFMIDKKGKVKLMDFGIAKTLDSTAAEYTQTGTGMQMGTPMYMSPEQITETKSVTAQSDIYSLGVVLWQMVTGKKPYDTKTLSNFQLQTKIVTESLAKTNTHWDSIIQQATGKDCLNRYQSSADLKKVVLAPSTAKCEDSDSTQIDVKRPEVVKESNPIEEPQITSKPTSEKSTPIEIESQKSNSNSLIVGGVVIFFLILFAFLMQNRNDDLTYDYAAADSIATVDSLEAFEAVKQVTFTNNSTKEAWLSVAYLQNNEQVAEGWYQISPGGSYTYFLPYSFVDSKVFWYAISGDYGSSWTGTDLYLTVDIYGSTGFKVKNDVFEYSGGGQSKTVGFHRLDLMGQSTTQYLSD